MNPALPDRATFASAATAPTGGAGDYPDQFKFTQPGDELFGLVVALREVTTKHGDTHVCEIDDTTIIDGKPRGLVSFWVSNAMLVNGLIHGNNQLGRQIKSGDLAYIRFDGKEQIDGGKTLSKFAINIAAPATPQAPAAAPAAAPQAAPQAWGQPAAAATNTPF